MRVLVAQRQSHVSGVSFSLSVFARVVEAMEWLRDQGRLHFVTHLENDPEVYRLFAWADAVVFCKNASPNSIELAARARDMGKKVLLDFDDWTLDFPSYSGGPRNDPANTQRVRRMLELADVVTVANVRLLQALRCMREDLVLVPNGIYVEKYPEAKPEEPSRQKLVFTNADLLKLECFRKDFLRVLQDFWAAHPKYTVDFYGDPFPELISLPFIHYTNRISYGDYLQCLANGAYHFSIIPLGGCEDEASRFFNSCKNPFKYINYGLLGIPGVYSNTDLYKDVVVDGETGLLVENTYEAWVDAMNRLASSYELRQRIREQAREDVKRNFHIKDGAEVFWQLLSS
ncbi:glycosyltransferase [Oceanidesulfovibrio marinus]|uniref:Glycosyltransferase family 1 protein n=1 Tax=Oceanidesulfovibrio marinus TaxID=370038 RepID=A0A6P1ZP45_9BACT|nr:glycosyltransferase [Oceanidesulfovibrio marinus]QJT09797.1 glycosyltransferase family 4 protein [Oceanidesulfovibrio marinus]TVM36088.1 glycosyltransferase family 1 protein [Oceanidesulfovibrio marinus]